MPLPAHPELGDLMVASAWASCRAVRVTRNVTAVAVWVTSTGTAGEYWEMIPWPDSHRNDVKSCSALFCPGAVVRYDWTWLHDVAGTVKVKSSAWAGALGTVVVVVEVEADGDDVDEQPTRVPATAPVTTSAKVATIPLLND